MSDFLLKMLEKKIREDIDSAYDLKTDDEK
jgi:hypothetical protein